jgi:cytochrome P450 family 142 subfamily A polypeptide 1
MADEEILMESLLLLVGGDETTRHVMTGGMYELLRRPHDIEALARDPAGIPRAVEEMLRWVSPIRNMNRTATVDVEINGQQVKEGDRILLLYPSANRDESRFVDPMTFDIERTPNEHVAFGFGSHFCLGSSLARLELTVAFETLLDRLPDLRLAPDVEPANRPANFVSGYESMPAEFTPGTRIVTARTSTTEGN